MHDHHHGHSHPHGSHHHNQHQHEHEHEHHHHHEQPSHSGGTLSDHDKLAKIMEHWLRHNQDHADSYKDWAIRARGIGEEQVAEILEDVADMNHAQNEKIRKAMTRLQAKSGNRP